jgi:hypothetical protein
MMMHMRSWHYYRTVKKMRETSDDMRHIKREEKTTIEKEKKKRPYCNTTDSVLCQEWRRDGIRGV